MVLVMAAGLSFDLPAETRHQSTEMQEIGPEADPDASSEARWVPVASNTTQHLRDVHFANPSYGWIGGANLTILRSTTGGASWTPAPPNPGWATATECCLSVSTRALPSPEAWLAGPVRALRYGVTSNSGAYSYGAVILNAVFPIPGSDATWYGGSTTASGGSLRLYRKTSSSTLTVIFFTGGIVRGIFFANENEGWAVATAGTLVHITNGTASQPAINVSSADTSFNLNSIFMIDARTGWIVGDRGTILRTTTGTSWGPAFSATVNNLRDVAFRDRDHGVIVGDAGLILVTSDGGASWKVEPSGTPDDLYGVSWADGRAVAVGNNGTILMRIEGRSGRRRAIHR
jgi:hypothetical protein